MSQYNVNPKIASINATLDSDTGKVRIVITDKDGEVIMDKSPKLSNNNPKKEGFVRFTVENHPETGKDERFKGIIFKHRGWGDRKMFIYPQYGKGYLTNGPVKVNIEGDNEFFT